MIRHIEIDAVLNGFAVKVGCQTVVFTDVQTLAMELAAYLISPEAVEKRFLSMANARHTMNGAVEANPNMNRRNPVASEVYSQQGQCATEAVYGGATGGCGQAIR